MLSPILKAKDHFFFFNEEEIIERINGGLDLIHGHQKQEVSKEF